VSAEDPAELGKPQPFAFDALRATLGVSTDVDSCVQLTGRIDALMSQAIEYFRQEGAGIACRAGCSFCCHLRVMVLPHETSPPPWMRECSRDWGAAGLSGARVELHTAVAALLRDPALVQRWRGGRTLIRSG